MLTDLSPPGLPSAPADLRLVDSGQMRAIEQWADAQGHSFAALMAQAGAVVEAVVAAQLRPGGQVLILVGPGNNGGDGLVAGLALAQSGFAVRFVVWRRTGDDELLVRARTAGLEIIDWETSTSSNAGSQHTNVDRVATVLANAHAVVDALLGTGASRPLGVDVAELLDAVRDEAARRGNAAPATGPAGADGKDLTVDGQHDTADSHDLEAVSLDPTPGHRKPLLLVAVDLPTGLNADSGAVDPHTPRADITVTFGLPKVGQFLFPGAGHCGRLLLDDIGIRGEWVDAALSGGPSTDLTTRTTSARLLPERPSGGHKGTFGKVLVVAGSTPYTGAAYLAGLAAYRAGAGLVTIALPASIHSVVAGLLPEATFLVLKEVGGAIEAGAAPVVRAAWADYDAVLIGPGLGTAPATQDFMATLFDAADRQSEPPWPAHLVVDADGLNLLARMDGGPGRLPPETVLTPHPGEMGRLLGLGANEVNAARVSIARAAAAQWAQVVVLKGAYTLVAGPDGAVSVNPFATPLLATAGSGDVLSGAIAGLLAQGAAPRDAARLGAYLHAAAALGHPDAGAGRGLLAREIADGLPRAARGLSERAVEL